ncbi:hypothetical protein BDZ91DRAFT_712441, partial [Kalaharituber pfeilii]
MVGRWLAHLRCVAFLHSLFLFYFFFIHVTPLTGYQPMAGNFLHSPFFMSLVALKRSRHSPHYSISKLYLEKWEMEHYTSTDA